MAFGFFIILGFGDLFLDHFAKVIFTFLPEKKSNRVMASLGFCELLSGGQVFFLCMLQQNYFLAIEKNIGYP